jgi:hypothetical protein
LLTSRLELAGSQWRIFRQSPTATAGRTLCEKDNNDPINPSRQSIHGGIRGFVSAGTIQGLGEYRAPVPSSRRAPQNSLFVSLK